MGFDLLRCRFLNPKLGAVASGGEDSDEHIGRHALGIAVSDGGMGELSGLNDLGERNGEV